MSALRNIIRKLTPIWLLEKYRSSKKKAVRKSIEAQAKAGRGHTLESLKNDFVAAGIGLGDTILVHSSLSKIGYIEGGPQTFIDALLETVGSTGNILMPNSPNARFQLDYIRSLSVFDVNKDASQLGAITECFRKQENAIRSASPTEPVSCIGPLAQWFTEGHLGEKTPYTARSPFAKVAEIGGKILYVGVTLDNAGTSLHLLEDAVADFPYPVYCAEDFEVNILLADGMQKRVTVNVHNPEQSAKRKCDSLLPLFHAQGVYEKKSIGNAETLVFDAQKMLQVMLEQYTTYGVTMYTPHGNK